MGRYVYAALLQIPSLSPLRFQPLLSRVKKLWNSAVPKYVTFWDPKPVLQSFVSRMQGDQSLCALRSKCILSLRLFMLYRSIDLARLYRKISFVGDQPYVSVQRKGWTHPRWEAVPRLPSLHDLCPWTALSTYVQATAGTCAVGSEVFRSLSPPFRPLSSNSLGRITRQILQENGINVSFWKPHSTKIRMGFSMGLSR